jgi:hypothetical protein
MNEAEKKKTKSAKKRTLYRGQITSADVEEEDEAEEKEEEENDDEDGTDEEKEDMVRETCEFELTDEDEGEEGVELMELKMVLLEKIVGEAEEEEEEEDLMSVIMEESFEDEG